MQQWQTEPFSTLPIKSFAISLLLQHAPSGLAEALPQTRNRQAKLFAGACRRQLRTPPPTFRSQNNREKNLLRTRSNCCEPSAGATPPLAEHSNCARQVTASLQFPKFGVALQLQTLSPCEHLRSPPPAGFHGVSKHPRQGLPQARGRGNNPSHAVHEL